MSKTWFITGASRGFGRSFAESALQRGDRVAATARDTSTLAPLVERYGEAVLPLRLDVTDRAGVADAVARTVQAFGRLDVVVNNAGYGLFGMVEELTEQQLRDQMETNFFGAFWVTQAALPVLREQGSGHVVQVSSVGVVVAFPSLSGYHASKWALEGFSESLAQEVAGFGVAVTVVEPGGYATDWGGASAVYSEPVAAYDPVRAALAHQMSGMEMGDPAAVGPALLQVVDSEQPPLRVIFGSSSLPLVQHVYGQRLQTWEEWSALSRAAQG